jgi:hypothetical protein
VSCQGALSSRDQKARLKQQIKAQLDVGVASEDRMLCVDHTQQSRDGSASFKPFWYLQTN